MSYTEKELEKADRALAGIRGDIITYLILRRSFKKSTVQRWVTSLRQTADVLESAFLKGKT